MALFNGKKYTIQREIVQLQTVGDYHGLVREYTFYFPEKFLAPPVVLIVPPLFADGTWGYQAGSLTTEKFTMRNGTDDVQDETIMPILTDIEIFIFAMERL